MTPFGQILTGPQVEAAVLQTLRLWTPHYLDELGRQLTLPNALPAPRSYRVWSDQEHWPEDQTPAVIVVCPGIVKDSPTRNPTGYDATWRVSAGCVVTAVDQVHVRHNAGVYAAALRSALVQHPSLGGRALATRWRGEDIVQDAESGRTTALAIADFEVDVADVVDPQAGPLQVPDPVPPGGWPDWPQIEEFAGQVIHEQEDTP